MAARRVVVGAVAAAIIVAIVVAAVRFKSTEPAQIRGATLSPSGRALEVQYVRSPTEACGGAPVIRWSESDDRIVINIGIQKPFRSGPQECFPIGQLATAQIELSSPLGDRLVVDGRTGARLFVERQSR